MTALGIRPAPGCSDYLAAIQNPRHCFTVPILRDALTAKDFLGLPEAVTGASAVVFNATFDHGPEALRCYTNMGASNRERYEMLGRHLLAQGPAAVARAEWLDDAIIVQGETWPVLRMEWVSGPTLDRYVELLVDAGDTSSLGALSVAWLQLCDDLVRADFAHGDLQHGNVLVDDEGRLRLVDLDGVWIPELAGFTPPAESGHRHYQHPSRRDTKRWDRWIDTVSALVVYVTIRALAIDLTLWHEFHDDEQLILSQGDFEHPGQTRAWHRLAAINDREIQELSGLLYQLCEPLWSEQVTLRQLLDRLVAPRIARWWDQASTTTGGLHAPASTSMPTAAASAGPAGSAPAAPHPASSATPQGDGLPWAYTLPTSPMAPGSGPVGLPAVQPLRRPQTIPTVRRAGATALSTGAAWSTPAAGSWWDNSHAGATARGGAGTSRPTGSTGSTAGSASRSMQPVDNKALSLMLQWFAVGVVGLIGLIATVLAGGLAAQDATAYPIPLGLAMMVLTLGGFGFVVNLVRLVLRSRRGAP
jgi:hypothetical protein